jgi:hypothetical protein
MTNTFLQLKQFFRLLFLMLPCLASAQGALKSELNLPRAGDELVKEQVVYCNPGEAGENRTWDFSRLKGIDDAYIVHYFTREDWNILGAENGKLTFLQVHGDSLLTGGYETPTDLVKYHPPGLLLRFPVAYGTSSESFFSGRGKHHDRLESAVSGEIHTAADASGSLILPGNDTLHSVIRVHIQKIENARYLPLSSDFSMDSPANDSLFSAVEPERITTDTYQWYEEGYRYPVVEILETYRDDLSGRIILQRDAYFYHPAEQTYLPEDTANRAVLERKLTARQAKRMESVLLSLACYPNPVKDRLEIELTLRQATAVQIDFLDMHGRLLKHFPLKTPAAHYRETFDVHSFPPGYYMVKVSAGGETVSEKILKQ